MKLFILIACILLGSIARGQQVYKVDIAAGKEDTKVVVSWKDSANKLIDSAKSFTSFQKLRDFLGRQDVQADTAFKRLADSLIHIIDSAFRTNSLTGIKLTPFGAAVKSDQKSVTATGAACPDLAKIKSIVVKKTTNDDYEVAFIDATANPVSGFLIRQFNEALFYDKVSQSLLSLCGAGVPGEDDTAKVKSLIKTFSAMGLYQHMLEASLEVNDDEIYAGKLTIRKHLYASFSIDTVKKKSPAVRDSGAIAKAVVDVFTRPAEDVYYPEKNRFSVLSVRQPADRMAHSFVTDLLMLIDSTPVSGKLTENKYVGKFTVHHIQIQFQDGFIENIKVRGKVEGDDRLLKFENAYPIPFSTRRDYRKLQDRHLYERTVFARIRTKGTPDTTVCIRLGDLLDYDQNLDLNSKDYSPANYVWESAIEKPETVVNLQKERTSKILELKVFSDLKGIEDNNPNGLVQLELSKKLNFWNNRGPWLKNNVNVGFLNSVTPSFAMTKIESTNKRLALNYIGAREPDTLSPNVYASSLKFFQHQAFKIGLDATIITIDIPGLKSVFNVKGGLYFGRTLTSDTVRTKTDSMHFEAIKANNVIESGVNTLQLYPELSWQVFPDKRYGITLSQKFIHYKILTNDVKQVVDSADYVRYITTLDGKRDKINDYKPNRWIGSAEIYAFYRPSDYNQVFFRYRLNWQMNNARINFHQIQVGFATYLTHTSKGKKEQQQETSAAK